MLVSQSALRAARYQTLTPLQHVSTNCRLKDLPSGMVPKLGAKEVWLLCNFRKLALSRYSVGAIRLESMIAYQQKPPLRQKIILE